MTTLTIDTAAALAPFGDGQTIPLVKIGNHFGWNRDTRNDLVSNGLIRTVTDPDDRRNARGRRVLVDRGEAAMIVASVLIATALGLAIATVIRGLRSSGATITANAVSIPLPGIGAA